VQDGAAITFFDRTFDEAMALLVEARGYLLERQYRGSEGLPPRDQLVASCETMRLTSRLAQVMAWLLVQKAVHAGEIDAAAADEPNRRLGGHEICAETGPWDVSGLPRRLLQLLDRSHALYNRVARLDEMVHIRASQARAEAERATAAGGTGAAPVGMVPDIGAGDGANRD
jgi:regulator of CtrA degradation